MAGKRKPETALVGIHKQPIFKADFNAHALYIADHNPDAALNFVDAVDATLGLIAARPHMGALRTFADGAVRLRMVVVTGFDNYLIYYQPFDRGLLAIRLLHSSMDSDAVFD